MIEIGNIQHTDEKYRVNIYDKKRTIKACYAIGEDALYVHSLMQEHFIKFSFNYDRLISFHRGDYIEWKGTQFILRTDYLPEEINTCQFKYNLQFDAKEMLSQDVQMYYTLQDLKEINWSLTSKASSFMTLVVENLNRYFNTSEWKVGMVEPTELKAMSFSNTNVWNALVQIAQTFDAEFYFTGTTLHLVNKLSIGTEIPFEKEVSVLSMSRSDGDQTANFNRITAFGSSRNIPRDYRTISSGQSTINVGYQKRLQIPSAKGSYIDLKPGLSPEEIVEGSVIFEDVYPKRVGKIEAVETTYQKETNEKTKETIEWYIYSFKDSGINFKSEYLLPEENLRISFQSGDLAGRDFGVRFHERGFTQNDSSQYFEILKDEEGSLIIPNKSLCPKVGDEYILYGFNIQLVSDQYVPTAEQELYDRVVEWLKENHKDTSVYSCQSLVNHFATNEINLDLGQKVKLISPLFEDGYRCSRIMSFEKKLYNIYDAIYTVGDNSAYSRLSNIEKKIDELKYAGQVYQQVSAGGSVYLIKLFDTTTPTEYNTYSAKASNAHFLKRDQEDVAKEKITFEKGVEILNKGAISDIFGNSTFTSGQFGSGFRMWKDERNGQSYAELDNLMVRREMVVNTLSIAEIKSIGGQILVSLASMHTTKVLDGGAFYQCYFETDNGNIPNQFDVNDLVICRRFNGENIKYYWMQVESLGKNFIYLTKNDKDGTGIPEAGDEIIQFGNRINPKRQSAIVISSYGPDAPSIKQYAGINSYDLTGREVTVISPAGNRFTGEFSIKAEGKKYLVQDYTREQLNAMQIGGRNLLQGSNYKSNKKAWALLPNVSEENGINYIRQTYGFAFRQDLSSVLKPGQTYTWSGLFRTTVPGSIARLRISEIPYQEIFIKNLTPEWQQKSITFTVDKGVIADQSYFMGHTTGYVVDFAKMQIEEGNKATSWSLAPEDIEDSINAIQVGGRNLFSTKNQIIKEPGTSVTLENNGFTFITNQQTNPNNFRINKVLKGNGWYTISGYVKSNQSHQTKIEIDFNDRLVGTLNINSTDIIEKSKSAFF